MLMIRLRPYNIQCDIIICSNLGPCFGVENTLQQMKKKFMESNITKLGNDFKSRPSPHSWLLIVY